MVRRSISLCVSVLLAFPFTVSARPAPQTASQTANPQLETVIRSSVRLVEVSVVVEDKKGNPVTDLKPEDFTVLDEGEPQQIAVFTTAMQATDQASIPPVRKLPRNVFTNRYDLKGEDSSGTATVVLLDTLNTAAEDQTNVRREVVHFLQSLKPQDHVAVYGLTTQLFVLHEFTRDCSDLVAAAQRLAPKELAAYDTTHTRQIDLVSLGADPQWARLQDAVNDANREIADLNNISRVGTTLGALEAIANHVSGIPGRKSLVWISGGFPIQIGTQNIGKSGTQYMDKTGGGRAPDVGDRSTASRLPGADRDASSFAGAVRGASESLSRANMAVYAIDAKGVELDPRTDPSMRGARLPEQVKDTSVLNAEQDARDSSKLLADRTGGLAFFGNNDVRGAIRRAFDDGRYAYNIAFYPNHGEWDGRFRKIKIHAKREGLRLRYRAGYYAFSDHADPNAVVAASLQKAADSPLDATILGMIISGKGTESLHSLELHIGIDPQQLLLQNSGDHRKGAVDLFFLQRDASGKTVAADKQHIDLNLEAKQYEYLGSAAMVLDRNLTIAPQSTEIRVVLRDTGSGSLGSVTLPTTAFFPNGASRITPVKQPN